MLKIVVCAVQFSPNLGDGIIYECIKYIIKRERSDAVIYPLDLAGRKYFQNDRRSGWKKKVVASDRLPKFLRDLLLNLYFLIRARKLKETYKVTCQDAGIIIVGGGQLFSGVPNNFPRKLAFLAQIAGSGDERKHAVLFVGAMDNWSPAVKQSFGYFFSRFSPEMICVRDQFSSKVFEGYEIVSDKSSIEMASDPAVCVAEVFPKSFTSENRIGVNIMHPSLMKVGDGSQSIRGKNTDLCEIYLSTIRDASNSGFKVSVFTNGEPVDEEFKDIVKSRFMQIQDAKSSSVEFVDRCLLPNNLASMISRCDKGVLASRLHCGIISSAYGIPVVAIDWNLKVREFYKSSALGVSVSPDDLCKFSVLGEFARQREAENIVRAENELNSKKAEVEDILRRLMEP